MSGVHVVDRRVRQESGSDDGGPGAAAGGSIRHREIRGRAGPQGVARDLRPESRHFSAAQRVRRTPEHRRQVPQRDRHLHEPDSAWRATDDFRRWRAVARVQLHR